MAEEVLGLCARDIETFFPKDGPPVRFLEETDSTNIEAKRWAQQAAPHGALVLARRQNAGRGRMGRGFSSPPGGIYASMVLRPNGQASAPALVTAAAAVAVHAAVQQVCGLSLGIKWVNDLYSDGKKCCGILAEAAIDAQANTTEYIVLGIGINYNTPQAAFDAVSQPATSLYPHGGAPGPAAQLAAAIHSRVLQLWAAFPGRDFLQQYRRHSMVLGRQVTVLDTPPWPAQAVAIDDDARLVVRNEKGEEKALSFGEISIQL